MPCCIERDIMDISQHSEIQNEAINLLECVIGDLDPTVEHLRFHLGITNVERVFAEENRVMVFQAGFDLMHKVENPAFTMKFSFGSVYSRPEEANMSWDEFTDEIILAHMIPFIREFIANTTIRLPIPQLLIPPMNTHVLLSEYRDGLSEQQPE
jgi:hypothetical protein